MHGPKQAQSQSGRVWKYILIVSDVTHAQNQAQVLVLEVLTANVTQSPLVFPCTEMKELFDKTGLDFLTAMHLFEIFCRVNNF